MVQAQIQPAHTPGEIDDHQGLVPKYLGAQSAYSAEQQDIILRDITLGVCIDNHAHSSIVELINIIAKSPVLAYAILRP